MYSTFRRLPRHAVGCASVAAAAIFASPVWADPAPSYAELLARLGQAPASLEAEASYEAAEARVRQAAVRPNPVLGLEVENAYGSGPYRGLGRSETTVQLSQDLEFWGRRPARVAVARAEAASQGLQRDLTHLEAAGRLALTYAEAEAAQRRADLAKETLDLTLADARAALVLVEQGREPLLRGIQGEAEAATARAALDEAEAEREAAFARLSAVAMLPQAVTRLDHSLLDRATPASTVQAVEALSVRVAEANRMAAEQRITVARIQARPDITASLGIRRFEEEDVTAVNIGLSMPLPLFDRNRGNIDATRAEFRAADARLIQVRQDAGAERAGAIARQRGSVSRVRAADAGVSAAQEAYRLTRLGFEAGRLSQVELRVTRAALVNARISAVEARMARARAEIDLARLDGRAPYQGVE